MYNPLEFDGWKQLHRTSPFVGEWYSLVWLSPELSDSRGDEDDGRNVQLRNNHAATPLTYRNHSTEDCLVIREILDHQKSWQVVLDIRAHVGIFSRHDISEPRPNVLWPLNEKLG
jgi:hypothetical protein